MYDMILCATNIYMLGDFIWKMIIMLLLCR